MARNNLIDGDVGTRFVIFRGTNGGIVLRGAPGTFMIEAKQARSTQMQTLNIGKVRR